MEIAGAATLEAGIWLNRSDVTRGGQTVVTFAKGYPKQFTFTVPSLRVYGLFVGERWGHYLGRAKLGFSALERSEGPESDETSVIKSPKELIEQRFGPKIGCALEFAKSGIFKLLPKDYVSGTFLATGETLKGRWMQEVTLDDVPVYRYSDDVGTSVKAQAQERLIILSDARRRSDIVAFSAGDVDVANERKLELEQRQRDARKLRGCE